MQATQFGEILLLEYPSNMEMNLATFRISEFFEGDLKGKKFTTDQFIEGWSDEDGNMDIFEYNGKFLSYFAYWDGLNFTKKSLDKFTVKFALELSAREKDVIRAARKSSYIIALTENGAESTRRHEFSHAFSFTDKVYKTKVFEIVESIPQELRDKFVSGLEGMGYSVGDHDYENEEIHAYLVGYNQKEYESFFPLILHEEITNYVSAIGKIYSEKESSIIINTTI
jgi:hypothetical protein